MDGGDTMTTTIPGSLYGLPHVKDGCGVFGIISRDPSELIPSSMAVSGICAARQRGSRLGAGFASTVLEGGSRTPFRMKAFVRDQETARELARTVSSSISEVTGSSFSDFAGSAVAGMPMIEMTLAQPDLCTISGIVDRINSKLISGSDVNGRIFSYGRYTDVFKGVGFPDDVAFLYGLQNDSREAHSWIAHSRQPTNSPGALPVWSHPFSALDCAIVHNGDISSFGANIAYLESRGYHSHIGTDSEVIARLLEVLLREEGLELCDALRILSNPHSRQLSAEERQLLAKYRNARLDGPFSVVGSYGTGSDCYLFAVTDRSKFRPLVLGQDRRHFYAASEESQIRSLSPDAEVWNAESASFFVCSVRRGLIASGTSRNLATHPLSSPAATLPAGASRTHESVNSEIVSHLRESDKEMVVEGVNGTRFIGMGVSFGKTAGTKKVIVKGYPGNCLANLNDGGIFEVFGSVADDLADTMTDGKVIVHGNAGDVAGQALQGGRLFVRGSVGNRAAIQMREFRERRPYFIIGETAGDYLGEYMAGGRVVVLNLSRRERPVGDYIGTGMVGGKIFIRGNVRASQVGLLPLPADVLGYLDSLCEEGLLDRRLLGEGMDLSDPVSIEKVLPPEVSSRVMTLYYSTRHSKRIGIEKRMLSEAEKSELSPVISDCLGSLLLPETLIAEVLSSEFSVISVE